MSRRAVWIWCGAAVLLAALPTLARLVPFGHTTRVGFFAYAPGPWTALIWLIRWQQYTGIGVPVLIVAAPLVARGRWFRPVAAGAAVLLGLVAASGVLLGVSTGFSAVLTGVRGGILAAPVTYGLAALALAVVAVRGRPGGRAEPVISEAP